MRKRVIFPQKSDYPEEMFRYDIPVECQAGCAKAYFRNNFIARRIFIRRIEEAVNLLPDRDFKMTLDMGTGAGILLPTLSKFSDKAYAIDLSPVLKFVEHMLDRRHIYNVYLSFGDVTNLPYHSNSFDLIVCLSIIEHIKDLKLAYTEMCRVLQKDGTLILGYPIENQVYNFLNALLRIEAKIRKRIVRQRGPTRQEWCYPHISTFEEIEREAQNLFRIEQLVNIRFLSFDLYRILRLVKKQI